MRSLGLSISVLLALVAGCKQDSSAPAGGSAAAGASASQPAGPAVRLGYFANLTHAQAVLGVDSGDFAKAVAPAKLDTKVFNAGPSLIEALFAGEIDIGYVGPSPVISGFVKSKGQGIRVVAGAAANGVIIVASAQSGINTLADLKGRKVATPQLGNTQDISARHYLINVLKQENANNVIPAPNGEQAGLMLRGDIEASWAPEPWGSRLVAEAGAKVIGTEADLWPEKQFTLTVVVTTPEFLAQHPDVVEALLKAHRVWTARLQSEPDKYAPQLGAAITKLTGKGLPEGVAASAIKNVKFTDEPLADSFKTFAQWSFDLKFSKTLPDLAGLIDTTILDRLKAAGQPASAPQAQP